MGLRFITADQRLAEARGKTTIALFGPTGVGKTSLLKTLPPEPTVCIDLEAGLKSVQDWRGDSIPIRTFVEAIHMACLIGGADPAAAEGADFSRQHYDCLADRHPEIVERLAAKDIVFVDSITDLSRQAMAWAQMQPDAFSEKTGKPDTRGAYGLVARKVIALLKHLQHAPGKTVIFVGILERVVDDLNREHWQPQLEGGKTGREFPGIVDQVISMSLFDRKDGDWRHEPKTGAERRLVCRSGNPFGLPAKDRSGRLDVTEPADLLALLKKINGISVS